MVGKCTTPLLRASAEKRVVCRKTERSIWLMSLETTADPSLERCALHHATQVVAPRWADMICSWESAGAGFGFSQVLTFLAVEPGAELEERLRL